MRPWLDLAWSLAKVAGLICLMIFWPYLIVAWLILSLLFIAID